MIRFRSLTVRLLLALVVPLIVSAALIGVGGAWVIKGVVDYTSDRLLAGSVRAIAETVTFEDGKIAVDLPPWSLGLLDSPQRDSVFYSVRQSGHMLTGYADLPDFDDVAMSAPGPVFRTIAYKGRSVRQSAEAVRAPGASAPVIISVAQTLDSRQAVRKTLLASVGSIEVGLVGLVALLIWPAALWSLRPLEGLRRRLSARSNSRDLDFTPVAVSDVPGELQSVVVAFNTLLSQLERSVDGVRRFTADASHQMRTPLAILRTHLTLLNRPRRSESDRESLTDAIDAVDRLQRLIEQLLVLARADAVDDQGHERADLAMAAHAAVLRWQSRVDAAAGSLTCEGLADGVYVSLHEPLVNEILDNLIDNAVRYGGHKIRIAVNHDSESAVLAVCDDGPGLSSRLAERPFERFVRGPNSPGVGSGLGLSIVQALSRRCGGDAVIARTEPSGEFCVRVSLPLAPIWTPAPLAPTR